MFWLYFSHLEIMCWYSTTLQRWFLFFFLKNTAMNLEFLTYWICFSALKISFSFRCTNFPYFTSGNLLKLALIPFNSTFDLAVSFLVFWYNIPGLSCTFLVSDLGLVISPRNPCSFSEKLYFDASICISSGCSFFLSVCLQLGSLRNRLRQRFMWRKFVGRCPQDQHLKEVKEVGLVKEKNWTLMKL